MVWLKDHTETAQTDKWLKEIDLDSDKFKTARGIVEKAHKFARSGHGELLTGYVGQVAWVKMWTAQGDVKVQFTGKAGSLTLDFFVPMAADAHMQVTGRVVKNKPAEITAKSVINWVQYGESFFRGSALDNALVFDIELSQANGLFILNINLIYQADFIDAASAQKHAEKWLQAKLGGNSGK